MYSDLLKKKHNTKYIQHNKQHLQQPTAGSKRTGAPLPGCVLDICPLTFDLVAVGWASLSPFTDMHAAFWRTNLRADLAAAPRRTTSQCFYLGFVSARLDGCVSSVVSPKCSGWIQLNWNRGGGFGRPQAEIGSSKRRSFSCSRAG